MTEHLIEQDRPVWTCPFCLLLCDKAGVTADAGASRLLLTGAGCDCARRALRHFGARPSTATPLLNGQPCSLEAAVTAAAGLLAASRQPLFGGLGTDVAGARALYRLAAQTGAICDPAGGEALMQNLRVLQDRGQFSTTLAEIRTRADLIVCIGGLPLEQAPNFFDRCGVGEPQALVPQRHVVLLGGDAADALALGELALRAGVSVESIPLQGDLHASTALLCALAGGRLPGAVAPALAVLVERLRAAQYAVLVGEPRRMSSHGGLVIEGINRLVGTLNQHSRAAVLWLGGANGAATVNQVFTWLGGLPLRSRAGPLGLEHEPLCFASNRLLAEGAVDCLLWISSFTPESAPPPSELPLIVLGHPELAEKGQVFIPVSTPGIGSGGHLFRADGVVMLPLQPVYQDTLPTLAEVVQGITGALKP